MVVDVPGTVRGGHWRRKRRRRTDAGGASAQTRPGDDERADRARVRREELQRGGVGRGGGFRRAEWYSRLQRALLSARVCEGLPARRRQLRDGAPTLALGEYTEVSEPMSRSRQLRDGARRGRVLDLRAARARAGGHRHQRGVPGVRRRPGR